MGRELSEELRLRILRSSNEGMLARQIRRVSQWGFRARERRARKYIFQLLHIGDKLLRLLKHGSAIDSTLLHVRFPSFEQRSG